MKIRKTLVRLSISLALLAELALVPALRAQSVGNRILLIFDTSSAMKKRLPAEARDINQLFAITLNGRLRHGDTVGVWTFNQEPHIGQFPLQEWSDDKVTIVPDEIIGFLKTQHYTKETSFDDLLAALNNVVRTSPRLTTIIFCDGDGEVKDIPGTDVINATFKKHQREMAKARVPFVIVLRSQFGADGIGRYVRCTINSADSIVIPQFPPMPVPPAPAPVEAAPPPPPPPMAAPLIIIGTNTETNVPPATPPPAAPQQQPAPTQAPRSPAASRPPVTPPAAPQRQPEPALAPQATGVSAAPAIPVTTTNSAPLSTASIEPTNQIVPPPQATTPIPPATATVVPPAQTTAHPIPPATATVTPAENSSRGRNGLLAVGAGILVVVVGALYLVSRRSRGRGSASLITESLKKR